MEAVTLEHLAAQTELVRRSPRDRAPIELIVRRPAHDERDVLEEAVLDSALGLVGDDWIRRGSSSTPDGSADPESQLTIMNTRVLAAFAPDRAMWPLAGDQLYADLDISLESMPAGTRLAIGDAEVVVTAKLHTGCSLFMRRYGAASLAWISSPAGTELRMRGVYVRILRGATIRVGDVIHRI